MTPDTSSTTNAGAPGRSAPAGLDLSLSHLEAELARMDVLLRREVRRWQRAGQEPSDSFRGLYVSDAQAASLLARPLASSWGQITPLTPEEEEAFAAALARASQQAQALANAARCQRHPVRLEGLASAFGLDRLDLDVLLICLAPALDLRYERVYGYLQDDVTRKRPGVSLVLDLLCGPGAGRLAGLARLTDDAPLLRHQIVERNADTAPAGAPFLAQSLAVDETIVAWLLGRYQPGADLARRATLTKPGRGEAGAVLAGGVIGGSALLQQASPGPPPILVLCGPDTASQEAAARNVVAEIDGWMLRVRLESSDDGHAPQRAVRRALRDARLVGAVPVLEGWDACLSDGAPPPDLLAELCAHPGPAIVAGRASWQPRELPRDRQLLWIETPIPDYAQRLAVWAHFLGEGWDLTALAGQFQLTTSQIRDAVATARDRATQRGEPICGEDLFAAARAHSNPRLSSLAHKLVPRYAWDDIVLPEDQKTLLREIVATVRWRPQVLDGWGLGHKLVSSRGITALFSGPPGTGKTMAAEILAAELGLDLYKIDLSTVVSKYIGETEKNLERIFVEAERSNAILFFDEADALFGKRSEVRDSHDRYANIEISYLLQRMEAYDGVTILATNLRANLDEAFTRRLQFAVDFPFPEEKDRLRIWHTLFPPEVPREAGLDFRLLARRLRIPGGSIRNIIVSATYLAASDGQSVTMAHLLHGARRELQKMGRLIGEEDLSTSCRRNDEDA